MTLTEIVNESYLCYRGKLSSVPPVGTEKYNRIVMIANRKQREWALDPNVDWPSRYEIRPAGTLTTGNQSYDLDDDIIRLSDFVIMTDSNGHKTYVNVVKPQLQARLSSGCFISGFDPKQLTFIAKVTATDNGKALSVPCFTLPATLSAPTSIVSVDNPQWLIYAVAGELARNDNSKEEQYSNIIGQANDIYQQMMDEAQSNGYLQMNGVVNNMPQVSEWGGNNTTPWGYN